MTLNQAFSLGILSSLVAGILLWLAIWWFGKWFRELRQERYRAPVRHFVSPEVFYARYLGRRGKHNVLTHQLRCVGRDKELASIETELTNPTTSVFVVDTPPGHGKSRFALELARRLRGDTYGFIQRTKQWLSGRAWQVYFVPQHSANVLEFVQELRKRPHTALFLDNAHEVPDVARHLATYAGASQQEGRLIVVYFARTSGSYLVTDALSQVDPFAIKRLTLPKLSQSDIEQIVVQLLPRTPTTQRSRIVEYTKDSPFLAVMVCQLVSSGTDFSEALSDVGFRRRICDVPLEEVAKRCNIASHNVIRALAAVAACAPVDRENATVKGTACVLAGISDADFRCVVDQVCKAGLFSQYGGNLIRPTPDLIGDMILDSASLRDDGSLTDVSTEILNRLLKEFPRNILNNLADVGWTLKKDVDVIAPILEEWRAAVSKSCVAEQRDILDRIAPLAVRRAPAVLAIVEEIWKSARPHIVAKDEEEHTRASLLADAVPILEGTSDDPNVARDAMNLLKAFVLADAVETVYDNRKAQHALIEIVGFSPWRSVEHTAEILSVVEEWFEANPDDAKVALRSIEKLLSPAVQWTESQAFSFSWRATPINVSDKLIGVRQRALNLILKALESAHLSVQLAAFDATDAIGRYRYGANYNKDDRIAKVIEDEMLQVVVVLARMLVQKPPLHVRRRIEKRLWNWWRLWSDNVAKVCADALAKLESSPQYEISKILCSGEIPVCLEVPKDAARFSQGERTDYLFDENRDKRRLSLEFIQELLEKISDSDDPAYWIDFFTDLIKGEPYPTLSWRARTLFEALAQAKPRAGWAMFQMDGDVPWTFHKDALLFGLKAADKPTWETELRADCEKSDIDSVSAMAWLRTLDWRDELDDLQWQFIEKCRRHDDVNVRRSLAGELAHAGPANWTKPAELLLQICMDDPSDEKNLDNLFNRLVHNRPDSAKTSLCNVDEAALALVLRPEVGEYVPWDSPYWCGEFLGFVAQVDADRFLNFVEQSLRSAEERSGGLHFFNLGARNASEAFSRLSKTPSKRTYIRQFITWAGGEDSLGEFARAVLSEGVELEDPDLLDEIERLYQSGAVIQVARIVTCYEINEEWVSQVRSLMIRADEAGNAVFNEVEKVVATSHWIGSTTRKPGQAAERDRICSERFENFSEDKALPSRVRQYFGRQKEIVDEKIQRDLAGDEKLAGGPL